MTLPATKGRALVPYEPPEPEPLPILDAEFRVVPPPVPRSDFLDAVSWVFITLGSVVAGMLVLGMLVHALGS